MIPLIQCPHILCYRIVRDNTLCVEALFLPGVLPSMKGQKSSSSFVLGFKRFHRRTERALVVSLQSSLRIQGIKEENSNPHIRFDLVVVIYFVKVSKGNFQSSARHRRRSTGSLVWFGLLRRSLLFLHRSSLLCLLLPDHIQHELLLLRWILNR